MLLLTAQFHLRTTSVELRFVTKFFSVITCQFLGAWSTRVLLYPPAVVTLTLYSAVQNNFTHLVQQLRFPELYLKIKFVPHSKHLPFQL